MGTSPPMSARRNANNTLSTLSRLNDSNDNKDGATNNRVRPPLFADTTDLTNENDAMMDASMQRLGGNYNINGSEGNKNNNNNNNNNNNESTHGGEQNKPYDEKEANEVRDASTKLLAEIAAYLESTKTEEERERDERKKEVTPSVRKRKTPVKKNNNVVVKKEDDEAMMSTPPTEKRKASNAAATTTTTPNTNATLQQIKGGLKSFAMKVCEKVKEKGTTTYDDVSDALVADVLAEREKQGNPLLSTGGGSNRKKGTAVNKKEERNEDDVVLEGDGLSSPKRRNKVEDETNDDRKEEKKKKSKRANETVDEKNIRRRVYDALNVLIAINVVSRDTNESKKKTITWNGIGEEFGDASLYGDLAAPPKDKNKKQEDEDQDLKKKKEEEEEEKKEEMTAEEQEAMDKEDRETRERIRKKALYLAELNEQFDALLALVQRNERNEMEAKKKVPTPKKTKPVKKEAPTAEELVKGNRSGSAKKESTTRVKQGDEDNITTGTNVAVDNNVDVPSAPDGIQLPFILVQTDQKATVEVEISEDQRVVHFNFNESPFQVYDGNYVLKHTKGIRTEMTKMKKERMQRLGVKEYDESIFQSPEEEEKEEKETTPMDETTPKKKAKKKKKTP